MKTTIDIADDLAEKAGRLAKRRGTTLRSIIDEGLRLSLGREQSTDRYHLPDKHVDGNGLQPEFRDKSWPEMRKAAYEAN